MKKRRLTSYSRLSLVIICSLMVTVKSYAELPPSYYLELQNKASEYLKIEVIAAQKENSENSDSKDKSSESITNVELEAKVLEVSRSKSGLKPGDRIKIKYSHTTHRPGWAGPGEIPVLEAGNVRSAFLSKVESKDFYEPAAKGKSFADLLRTKHKKR
jgi:hypothetical protein